MINVRILKVKKEMPTYTPERMWVRVRTSNKTKFNDMALLSQTLKLLKRSDKT